MVQRLLMLLSLLGMVFGAAAQDLYKSTMPNGKVVYGEKPEPGAKHVEKLPPPPPKTGTAVLTPATLCWTLSAFATASLNLPAATAASASASELSAAARSALSAAMSAAEPLPLGALSTRAPTSVIEVFANDRQAITRRIYPDAASTGIEAFATGAGARLQDLTVWDMMPSNPY